ncbi:ATP-binding protein [Leifsonia shinshuensis]|uniref:ATP-binding protein n=1 Tax=Leifsonia TaxID=110932 RepID=UPI00285AC61D|nr:ATP-binding protein [Leifsonia shinshuensis]MDR6969834.1 DNA helicase HerA-like ATPase [Leifsonia shinshuensis]
MIPLTVGTRAEAPDRPAVLDGSRFNRHTFWCGQSGSGKTYALGVVLEQLLLETELPLAVFDPNADFTELARTRDDVSPADAARWGELDIRVFHSSTPREPQLRIRYIDLSVRSKASVARLDPIADEEEFNALLHLDVGPKEFSRDTFLQTLAASSDPARRRLGLRIDNLGILDWPLWAFGGASVTAEVEQRPPVVVLDVGGFSHPAEPQAAALGILEDLWERRMDRRPVLIVIDEAHNFCPPVPRSSVEAQLTEQLIQIAAEGRKFGLWLFLSTQRPTKIHPNVLSQCDNLGLMRMNSPRDLAELADVFGFVPRQLLEQSPSFRKGEALFAGSFTDEPQLVRIGRRLTVEGGSDLSVAARSA